MDKLKKYVLGVRDSLLLRDAGITKESVLYWTDTRKSWKDSNCPPVTNYYDIPKFVPFHNIDENDPEIELNFIDEARESTRRYNNSVPVQAYTMGELMEIIVEIGYINDVLSIFMTEPIPTLHGLAQFILKEKSASDEKAQETFYPICTNCLGTDVITVFGGGMVCMHCKEPNANIKMMTLKELNGFVDEELRKK